MDDMGDDGGEEDNYYFSSYTWDFFTDGSAGGTNYPTSSEGHNDSLNVPYITSSTGGMITGSGNLYGISSALQISIINELPVNNISMTLSTLGSALDFSSVKLISDNGILIPNNYNIISQEDDQWGGSAIIVEFNWENLNLNQTNIDDFMWYIEFSATGPHMSLDYVILDLNPEIESDDCVDNSDPNADGFLDVLDIVYSVSVILGFEDWDNECSKINADINNDGNVNVLDIVLMVESILGDDLNRYKIDATKLIVNKNINGIQISSNGYVGAIQIRLSHDHDFEITTIGQGMVSDYHMRDQYTDLIIVEPKSSLIFESNGYFNIESVIAAASSDYIETEVVHPTKNSLSAAYPNPFNPITNMTLELMEDSNVSVTIHNINGQKVDELIKGNLKANYYDLTWDASNKPSGVYIVRFQQNNNINIQKITLLK